MWLLSLLGRPVCGPDSLSLLGRPVCGPDSLSLLWEACMWP